MVRAGRIDGWDWLHSPPSQYHAVVCVESSRLLTVVHKELPDEATEPMVSTAQGHWCHVPGSVVWQTWEMWVANVGGRAEMDGAVASSPISALLPGARADPHQIPRASGQSRAIPAAVRSGDTGLSKRKWSWREIEFMGSPGLHGWSQGTLTGSSTPCPTGPICHAGDSPWLSQAGALAFLAWEAEGCWCTAHPVPGAGEAPAECHKPAFLWPWAGTWGQESEVAMSCWG